jgi:hypothetical protein
MMNEEQDYVFHYEPDHRESSHQNASAPIHKGRYGLNLNRKGNPVMFDSGPSLLGPGPTKRTHLHFHDTPVWVGAAISSGANPKSTTPTRMRGSVMGGSVLLEPGPHRLNTPNIPRPKEIPTRRIADVDISLSLVGIIDDMPGINLDSTVGNDAEYWMKLMKLRQNRVEEKLERFQKGIDTLTTTVQGAESMYRALQGEVEDLKSNSDEVWQK